MRSKTPIQLLSLAVLGLLIYLIDRFFVPQYGMGASSAASAALILILLVVTRLVAGREPDEREKLLQVESDSTTLYVVIAGLLAATIFYPHSDYAMTFWAVLGLAAVSRIASFLYHRYK